MSPRSDSSADLDTADAAYAAVFAALAVWSWVGIGLAEAGRFHLVWLVVLAGPASAVAAAAAWRALRPRGRSAGSLPATAALVVVAALASWLAARPGEYLVDGSDGSVYLNIGRAIARHHGLTYPEPVLELLPAAQWDSVLSREHTPPRVLNLFPGGIQLHPDSNAVQPSFFHLFPVWVAIGEVIGGPLAAYYVSPVFGVMAIVAFWLLTRGFTSALAATLASLLLLANFAQIWFMRVPTTEIMTQAFLLSGLHFAARCHRRPEPTLGVLGAAAFGLAAFARIDVLMLVLPIVCAFLALLAIEGRWRRPWTWFAVVLAGVTAHAIGHALLVSASYTERILFHTFHGRAVSSGSRANPPLVLVSGAVALLLSRRAGVPVGVGRVAWLLFVVVLTHATLRIVPQSRDGFLLLLLSPVGLGLVLVATAVWLADDRTGPAVLIVGLLLVSTMVYGESARDRAAVPMVLRRFVPIVLPLATLSIGVLIDRAWRRGVTGRVVALAVWATLAALWVAPSRAIIATTPMRGVHDEMGRLAATLPADAVVIADSTTPSHFGLSLHMSFGRDVVWVSRTETTAGALEALARRTDRPLVVARGQATAAGALTAGDVAGLDLSLARVETLRMTQLETAQDRLPTTFVDRSTPIQFYIARPREATAMPVTVEIGAADLPGRLDGFHDAEQMGESSARWTRDTAHVQLPKMQTATGSVLVLRLAAPRPAAMPPPVMRVSLEGVQIGTTPALGPVFRLVELSLPDWSLNRLACGPSVLTVSVPTFVPAEHGMGADARQLGAVLDWVRVDAR